MDDSQTDTAQVLAALQQWLTLRGLPPELWYGSLRGRLDIRAKTSNAVSASPRQSWGIRLQHLHDQGFALTAFELQHTELQYHFDCTLKQNETIVALPEPLKRLLSAEQHNHIHNNFYIKCGAWSELSVAAHTLRSEVFVKEQGVAAALEYDDFDASSTHLVAFNLFDQAVATARILQDGHIGRVAVKQALRGIGLGRLLMLEVEKLAGQQGHRTLLLNAQQSAVKFYLGLDYQICSAPFHEAGIEHVAMRKVL